MDWSDWKCTPLHFLMYNFVPENLDKHGTHPWYLHLVNIIILYGPLGIISFWSAIKFFGEMVSNEWRNKPGIRTVYALTMFTFVTSVGVLSYFPHQEPRFLIPLTIPIVLMNAHKLRVRFFGLKPFLLLWYIFNITGLCFFGFTHQGGVTQLLHGNRDIFPAVSDNVGQVNIIFSHTYMPPKFQLLLPPSDKDRITNWHFDYPLYYNDHIPKLNLIEMGSKPVEKDVKQKLIEVILEKNMNPSKNVKTYVAIPTILEQKLEKSLENILQFTTVYYKFPHVSVESLPEISNVISTEDWHLDVGRHWAEASDEISEVGLTRYMLRRMRGCIETISLFGFSVIEVKLNSESVKSVQLDNFNTNNNSKKEVPESPTLKKAKRSSTVRSQKNE